MLLYCINKADTKGTLRQELCLGVPFHFKRIPVLRFILINMIPVLLLPLRLAVLCGRH